MTAQPSPRQRRWLYLGFALVAVLLAIGLWLAARPSDPPLQGEVDADTINVATKALARVDAITVEEGDRVQPGQVLARLSSPEITNGQAQAQAALDGAKAAQALADEGARAEDIASVRATWLAAQATADLARTSSERADRLFAQGVIAALNAAGLRPGEDVLVVGADGTSGGVKSIAKGTQLATSANSPAYAAGLFAGRIYDVTHGWQPRASERLLNWRSLTTTKENVAGYLKRFVDNDGVKPFDYRRISKVLHPDDWDPQAEVYPLDIDKHWEGIAKPEGWTYPKAYTDARSSGEFERVRAEYADHYKIKFDGPSPNGKA